jgi:L-amino acid N-acyltransferase YncA
MVAGGHHSGDSVKFSIRRAQAEDAESIADLLNPIIQAGTYTVMDAPITVEDQLSFIRRFPERGVYHVAVWNDDHSVVGIQDIQAVAPETNALRHVGEISTFVSLELQRSGIGGELTRATLEQAEDLGFRKIMATIRADNPDAVAFYERQGFEMVGTLRDHACLGGQYIDEILMERFIGQRHR